MTNDATLKRVDPEILSPDEVLRRLSETNERTQAEIAAWLNVEGPGEVERTLIRTLIDKLPDYLFVKDTKSRFVIVNQPLATDGGFDSAADLIGKTDFDFHPREYAQQFWDCEQSGHEDGRSGDRHRGKRRHTRGPRRSGSRRRKSRCAMQAARSSGSQASRAT